MLKFHHFAVPTNTEKDMHKVRKLLFPQLGTAKNPFRSAENPAVSCTVPKTLSSPPCSESFWFLVKGDRSKSFEKKTIGHVVRKPNIRQKNKSFEQSYSTEKCESWAL